MLFKVHCANQILTHLIAYNIIKKMKKSRDFFVFSNLRFLHFYNFIIFLEEWSFIIFLDLVFYPTPLFQIFFFFLFLFSFFF